MQEDDIRNKRINILIDSLDDIGDKISGISQLLQFLDTLNKSFVVKYFIPDAKGKIEYFINWLQKEKSGYEVESVKLQKRIGDEKSKLKNRRRHIALEHIGDSARNVLGDFCVNRNDNKS